MSSRRRVKVLNSAFKKKTIVKSNLKEEEEDDDDEEEEEAAVTEETTDASEHYVLKYNQDKVLDVVKKHDKNEMKKEENEFEYQSEDDSKSIQEVLEHVCGKCYKSFSSFQHFKAHSMYCKNDGEIARNILNMMRNLKVIEQESVELAKQNMCFCCKENWETAHSGHIRCPKCPKSFKNNSSFERHLCLIHSDSYAYQCNTCNAQCPSSLILELHQKAHQRGKPFACKKCGEEFTRKYHLNRHQMYSGCETESTVKKSVLCKVCGKEFYRLDNLRMHLKQHLGQDTKTKDYPCPYCDKAFYGTATLNIHIRTHTGERPFTCDLCGNSFPSNPALRKHRRTHTGERPYQCSQCFRAFSAKEVLNRHMKTHTGEKPHECKLCGKRFIQATQLKQHLITHEKKSAARSRSCRKCKLIFESKELLSKHMEEKHQTTEQNKNITCSQCNKTFQTEGGLKRHITRVHIQKDIISDGETTCDVCSENFENRKNLQFHKLKMHDNFEDTEDIIISEEIRDDEEIEEIEKELQKQGKRKNEEEWNCRFCRKKFQHNKNFIKHMEDDHGAVVLSADNQSTEYSTTNEKTTQIQLSIKEETSDGNIEIVDVVHEVIGYIDENDEETAYEDKTDIMDIDEVEEETQQQKQQQQQQTEKTVEICDDDGDDDDNDDDYVLIKLKKPKMGEKSPSPIISMSEKVLTENIVKLLDLLIEKDILLKFGYPEAPVEEVLLKVIKNCGHNPKKYDESNDYMTRLRDYVKLLFTVVVDNDSIKELLNNHPVDKVICQVLEMAEND